MLNLVFFFAAVLILLFILLFIKVNIIIEYSKNNGNDNLALSIYTLSGIVKYKYEVPLVEFRKKGIKLRWISEKGKKEKDKYKLSSFLDLGDLYSSFNILKEAFQKYIKKRPVIKDLRLKVRFGTGDAFYTGILSGCVWTLAGLITAFLCNNFKVLKKEVKVQSEFSKEVLNIDVSCIFTLRIVNIISIMAKAAFDYFTGKFKAKKLIGGDVSG